jgi:fumarylacetoacetate (FAA) hydrolase
VYRHYPGEAHPPFLLFGHGVRIFFFVAHDKSIFGAIDQVVERYEH